MKFLLLNSAVSLELLLEITSARQSGAHLKMSTLGKRRSNQVGYRVARSQPGLRENLGRCCLSSARNLRMRT